MLEDNDLNLNAPMETPPEESGNRAFLIIGGIMAGLVFLTLICMAIYLLVIRPGQAAKTAATQTAIAAQNAQGILMSTQTAEAALWTPTSLPSDTPTATHTSAPVVNTPTATRTPVIVVDTPTPEITATTDPATLAAMQTQLAEQMTATAEAGGTRAIGGEGMPPTGFADEVGIPSLVILALALVVVIFIARRLRKAPSK